MLLTIPVAAAAQPTAPAAASGSEPAPPAPPADENQVVTFSADQVTEEQLVTASASDQILESIR